MRPHGRANVQKVNVHSRAQRQLKTLWHGCDRYAVKHCLGSCEKAVSAEIAAYGGGSRVYKTGFRRIHRAAFVDPLLGLRAH